MKKYTWKYQTIQVPVHYKICPFCDWSWKDEQDRMTPPFCGGCGRRLYDEGYEDECDEYAEPKAYWKFNKEDRKTYCTNCNTPQFLYKELDFDWRPPYCPHCGASMYNEER